MSRDIIIRKAVASEVETLADIGFVARGLRNTHEIMFNQFGDLFTADNDRPRIADG